jgi:predicted cupin superfamily sugar epimerase
MVERASDLIGQLELTPHPEGGFFRQVFRSPRLVQPVDLRGSRAALTVIYYLLHAGQHSRWHAVSSDEQWTFVDGDPMDLFIADPEGDTIDRVRLGSLAAGSAPLAVVPAGFWQAARPAGGHTLVTCSVGPGFDYADFRFLAADAAAAARLSPRLGDLAALV